MPTEPFPRQHAKFSVRTDVYKIRAQMSKCLQDRLLPWHRQQQMETRRCRRQDLINYGNKTDKGLKKHSVGFSKLGELQAPEVAQRGGLGTRTGTHGHFPSAIVKRIPQDFLSKGNRRRSEPMALPTDQPHHSAGPTAWRLGRLKERSFMIPRSHGPSVRRGMEAGERRGSRSNG